MIPFHRLLITVAIVFCAGFAAWGWREYQASGGSWNLASAIAFSVFCLLLSVYLVFLKRFLAK
jgi:hypothetical protein